MENFTLFDWYILSFPVYFVIFMCISRKIHDVMLSDALAMLVASLIPFMRELLLVLVIAEMVKTNDVLILKKKE